MSDVIVAPNVRDLDELARDLGAWMNRRILEAEALAITRLSYPRGAGQSHETILFDATWSETGVSQTQGFVVRIKPSSFTVFPDNLFDQQYQIMQALHKSGLVRVARTMWFEEDPAILGAPFFLMEQKSGRVPVSIPPYRDSGFVAEATPAQRRRLWDGAVRQLAAIQLVPVETVRFLEGSPNARDGLSQEWDKYCRFVDWLEETAPQPVLRRALARLESLWPENQPAGMVWGDARIGNMMFDENFDVVAVMDWEQPSLGGALHDLAWFCTLADTMHGESAGKPRLEGLGTRAETIALWEEICGKSAADLEWYEEFTHLKMSCTAVRLGHLRGTVLMSDEAMAQRLQVT